MYDWQKRDIKQQLIGRTYDLMRQQTLTLEHLDMVFYTDPTETIHHFATWKEFILIDPDTIGGWIAIKEIHIYPIRAQGRQ